ncbi:hypothetical protein [uncultured Aquimarina sp.]|uniref:hypothetical protein n=1 Tax=uncultured Aquimarina sp. TaxID=575652 RepID=UPI00261A7683|nr:hypothetical protein [uncultured Aquimarina sp.]
MKTSKLLLIFVFFITAFACSSGENEMTETEKYFAEKYNAELVHVDFKQTETKTNGEITEKRQYILVEIINSMDYDKLVNDEKLFQAQCQEIGTFVLDSVEFDHIPFQPTELEINYMEKKGSWIFESYNTKTMTFNINHTD